jgi:hypothetical protein
MSGLNNPELIQELKEVEDQFNEGLEEIAGTPNQLHYEQLYSSLFMSREHAKKDVYARHGKNYKMKRIYGSDNHWFVPENYPRNNERNGTNAFENRPLNNANHPQNPINSQVSVNNYNNNPNIVNTSDIPPIRTSSKRGRTNENNDPNNANNANNANTIINEGYETNDPITQTRKKLKTRRGGKRKRNHRSNKTKRYAKKTQRRH